MTVKRFTLKHFESQDWAYDNNKPIHTKEMVDLLNELHEENQSLKFQLDECRNHKLFSRRELEKENEQLKKEKESLIKGIKDTAKQGADSITAVWKSKNRPTTINKGYYD